MLPLSVTWHNSIRLLVERKMHRILVFERSASPPGAGMVRILILNLTGSTIHIRVATLFRSEKLKKLEWKPQS